MRSFAPRKVVFALVSLAAVACSGRVATPPGGNQASGAGAEGTGAAAASNAPDASPVQSVSTPPRQVDASDGGASSDAATPTAALFCGQTLTLHASACSAAELQSLIVGQWQLCSTPSFFGTDEAGLEIDADGHWAKLLLGADGSLLPASGPGQEGTWSSVDTSVMNGPCAFQLDFDFGGDGGGGVGTFPVISAQDDHIILNDNGVWIGDYARSQ